MMPSMTVTAHCSEMKPRDRVARLGVLPILPSEGGTGAATSGLPEENISSQWFTIMRRAIWDWTQQERTGQDCSGIQMAINQQAGCTQDFNRLPSPSMGKVS